MYAEFAAVLVFLTLGTAFVVANLLLGWLVRPHKPSRDKSRVYECGEPTVGSAWIRYNSRFYTVALVYLLFDVEVVILVPAALVLRELAGEGNGWGPLVALVVFLLVLTLGLVYEWFYGNLNWIRTTAQDNGESATPREAEEE